MDLDEWKERLREESKVIVVEGKKDKKVLSEAGIDNVMTINCSMFILVERILKTRECILLVDLDKEGKKIYGRLKKELNKFGVKVDDRYRNFLFKNTRIRQIEGLKNYL